MLLGLNGLPAYSVDRTNWEADLSRLSNIYCVWTLLLVMSLIIMAVSNYTWWSNIGTLTWYAIGC